MMISTCKVNINELFLWGEGKTYYLLSPSKCQALSLPEKPNHIVAVGEHPASQLLPDELIQELNDTCKQENIYTRLYLHNSIPTEWQHCAWEELSLNSRLLSKNLQIIRYANFSTPSKKTQKKWLILNHWEETKFFSQPLQSAFNEIKTARKIDTSLLQTDLSRYQGLVIIAHGSEQAETSPLLTSSGETWNLKLPRRLPENVLIIACASEQHNFDPLIKECLEKGAKTIIAPNGKLDAQKMRDFLKDLFNTAEVKISDYLYQQQQHANSTHGGARCLRLYGALQPLVPTTLQDYRHLSLAYYYQHKDILTSLRQKHRLGQEQTAQHWINTTLKHLKILPASTQALVIDYCDYLSERWATDKSHTNSQLRRELKDNQSYITQNSFFKYYVQARTFRRNGNFERACIAWMNAYNSQLIPNNQQELADLYGLLVNILIDLNLPQTTNQIISMLDRAIRNDTSDFSDDRETKLLDRQARFFIRQADYTRAFQNYQAKAAKLISSSDLRELTTLLYAQAWVSPERPETTQNIEDLQVAVIASPKQTFEHHPYAIRTLTLAAWRTQDETLKTWLSYYADDIINQLDTAKDKGPAGMSFFFAHLAGILGFEKKNDLTKAEGALDADSYWLELAILLSIKTDPELAKNYLDKYQIMRDDCMTNLVDFWQEHAIAIDTELQTRKQQEIDLICQYNVVNMLCSGLIPL